MSGPRDSKVIKRAVTVAGHPTSVSMEAAYWDALKAMAARDGVSINVLITGIDSAREGPLSRAVRLYVLCRRGPLAVSVRACAGP